MRRIAIFDLDGTLIDSAPAIANALGKLCTARGLPIADTSLVRQWVSLGAPTLVGRALGLATDSSAEDVAAFRALYSEQPGGQGDLYPGIDIALTKLHEAGILLGIATNKPQALSEKILALTGIDAYFKAVVGGDATPQPKPSGQHLQHVLDTLRCSGPFDFIGDSSIDAAAAQAAGARFLWATWGYPDADNLAPSDHTLLTPSTLVSAILPAGRA